jgi:hypothetical protein
VAILISYNEVVGGPSTPLSEPAPVIHRSQSELSESAPYIYKVEAITSGDTIEVFINGWRPSTCHKSQEVLISKEAVSTKIIVRMQKSEPPLGQSCSSSSELVKLKVADLLKTQKSSYLISVLGHKGWHQIDLTHLMPEGLL